MGFLLIDGDYCEGGGQILRVSQALAGIIGQPIYIRNIRAKRGKPGLASQHLATVRLLSEMYGGELEYDEVFSL